MAPVDSEVVDKFIYKGVAVGYALVYMAIEGPRKKWVPKALRDPIALGVADQARVVDTPPAEVIQNPKEVEVVVAPPTAAEVPTDAARAALYEARNVLNAAVAKARTAELLAQDTAQDTLKEVDLVAVQNAWAEAEEALTRLEDAEKATRRGAWIKPPEGFKMTPNTDVRTDVATGEARVFVPRVDDVPDAPAGDVVPPVAAAPTVGEEDRGPEIVVADEIAANKEPAVPADPVIPTTETVGVEQRGEEPIDATEVPPPTDATEAPSTASAEEALSDAKATLEEKRALFVNASADKEIARQKSRTRWERLKEKLGAEPHKIRGEAWNKEDYREAAVAYRDAEKKVGALLMLQALKEGASTQRKTLGRAAFINHIIAEDKIFKDALLKENPPKREGMIRRLLIAYASQPKSVRYTMAFVLAGAATVGIGTLAGAGFSAALVAYGGWRGVRAVTGLAVSTVATAGLANVRGKFIEKKYKKGIEEIQTDFAFDELGKAAAEVREAITKQALQNKHLGWQKMLLATTLGGATALGSIYADPHFFPQGGAGAPGSASAQMAESAKGSSSVNDAAFAAQEAAYAQGSSFVNDAAFAAQEAAYAQGSSFVNDAAFAAQATADAAVIDPLAGPTTPTPPIPPTAPQTPPNAQAPGSAPPADLPPASPRGLFSAGIEVKTGNTTWGIIEQQLLGDSRFSELSRAQQDFVIDSYKDRLQALPPEQLKRMGFASGNIDRISVNNKINLTFLNDQVHSDAIYTSAGKLTEAQQANIMNYRDTRVPGIARQRT